MSQIHRIQDYATARAVLRDDGFAAYDLATHLRRVQQHAGIDIGAVVRVAEHVPFYLNGPRHQLLHLLSIRYLGATRLAQWRPFMQTSVDFYLDRLAQIERDGAIDLVRDFIEPVFRQVTGAVLGFDATETSKFDRWIKESRDLLEPMLSLRRLARVQDIVQQMMAYIDQSPLLLSPRCPRPVFAELLDQLTEDFTRQDAVALTAVLFVAAQAAPQTLSNIVLSLLRNPESSRQAASADAEAWAAANLETLLRTESSVQAMDRVATRDHSVGECLFHAGEHLHIDISSANRDPAVYPPAACPVSAARPPAPHLTFGSGIHLCPGAAFSRSLIGIALPRLLSRYPRLALVSEELPWLSTTLFHAVTALPCTLGEQDAEHVSH